MAQTIQGYGLAPYAQEALRMAEIAKGQGGMANTTAPVGSNAEDSGGASKVAVNTQPFNNALYNQQDMSENLKTAIPGRQAKALSDLRTKNAAIADADNRAQQKKNDLTAQMMFASGNYMATQSLAIPEVEQRVKQHVAEQKLMAFGINPAIPFSSGRTPV